MITTTHQLNLASRAYNYWYNGSNKGIKTDVSDTFKQLAYSSYTSSYYTSYWKFDADATYGSIGTINTNYYPASITITLTRQDGNGSWGSVRTGFLSVTNTSVIDGDGDVNTSYMNSLSIQPVASGAVNYSLSNIEGIINALAAGYYMTIGYATKPTSSTVPADITNYMGLVCGSATDIVLTIQWESRSSLYLNVGGVWKQATPYVNVGGVWKQATAFANVGGVWKQGI